MASSVSAETWRVVELTLSHGLHGRMQAPPRGATLLIPTHQTLTLHQDTLQRILRAPLDLLFLPADANPAQCSAFHGWCLALDIDRLSALAAELAGHRTSPARFRRRLQTLRALQGRLSPERDQCESLLQLLQLVGSPALRRCRQLDLLGLDQSIARLIALLLCGDLIAAARRCPEPQRGSKALIFDDLLLWIEANLHRPIQLRDLVQRSGYSQRSLRNFFHERFGCGPIHWIRSRRLERARERLLLPEPAETVSSIAASLGYPHLSQFSRDFQSAYQCRP
ncbi:MAG: helix-turn-helix domain-containing protein [Cyanobium sp.]